MLCPGPPAHSQFAGFNLFQHNSGKSGAPLPFPIKSGFQGDIAEYCVSISNQRLQYCLHY